MGASCPINPEQKGKSLFIRRSSSADEQSGFGQAQ
jgi:hypothetical protein